MAKSIPRPETYFATLPSAGYGFPRATLHKYVATRECVVKPGDNYPGGDAYEFIYRCTETGEERRYGLVNRTVLGN